MDVFPDFGSVVGSSELRSVVGASLMFVLIIVVLMLIVSVIIWAIASSTGNAHTATKARTGAWVALAAAALAGAGVAWVGFLIDVGQSLLGASRLDRKLRAGSPPPGEH